jgi:Amt family ammonium transporter
VFNDPSLGGPGFPNNWFEMKPGFESIGAQVWIQAKAIGVTILWSAIVAGIAYKLVDLTIGLRVSEDEEREGLDITSHGEAAYRT